MKSLGIYKVDFTDVSKYYNAGIWSMDWNILRFMLKKSYGIFSSLFWSPTSLRPATWGTRICHPHLPIKARTSNTSLHGNSAYSRMTRIGKVFPAVDMFFIFCQKSKDCTVVYNEIMMPE